MTELRSDTPREKCAVFGVYGADFHAARIAYFGLYGLQHRGQESAGIVSSDGHRMYSRRDMGLVAQVFKEEDLVGLVGPLAIGHNRYSTRGASNIAHVQPVIDGRPSVALAHNGNLFNTRDLAEHLDTFGYATDSLNDSELMHLMIQHYVSAGASLEDAVSETYPRIAGTGSFSAVAMTKDRLVAFRDPSGIRPLCLGKLNGGWMVASESCALDTVGAELVREIEPGEMVSINPDGVKSVQLVTGDQKTDSFESIYFARPDSVINGELVYSQRYEMGRQLASEDRPDVDIVVPVPSSAVPAAMGYSAASGIPYRDGFGRNLYVPRTFIQPEQHMRSQAVGLKLNPMPQVMRGQRIVIIDDSIVRGTTFEGIVAKARIAGAREVHVRIHSPMFIYPDFYGIDIPRKNELIAASRSLDEICNRIGADSLGYLSIEGLKRAIDPSKTDKYSYHVFDGNYPIPINAQDRQLALV